MRSAFIGVVAILVVGCAGSPHQIVRMSPDEIQRVSMSDLCFSYRYHQTETIANELLRRGIEQRDLRLIANQRLRIGMSERAAICSWGRYESVNTTTVAGSVNRQFVYRSIYKDGFLYTRNGVVTAWQD